VREDEIAAARDVDISSYQGRSDNGHFKAPSKWTSCSNLHMRACKACRRRMRSPFRASKMAAAAWEEARKEGREGERRSMETIAEGRQKGTFLHIHGAFLPSLVFQEALINGQSKHKSRLLCCKMKQSGTMRSGHLAGSSCERQGRLGDWEHRATEESTSKRRSGRIATAREGGRVGGRAGGPVKCTRDAWVLKLRLRANDLIDRFQLRQQ
jgi:hypothetical protein